MKSKTATIWVIGVIFVLTVLLTFIQPSVIHQLVVWVSGSFAVLVALALFVVGNWPAPAEKPRALSDMEIVTLVTKDRMKGRTDEFIAGSTGIDIDVVRSIP